MMVLFLLISLATFAQERLTPPLGLSFGMTLESAKIKLNSAGTFNKSGISDFGKTLTYEKVKIGSTVSDMVMCKFVNNALFEVVIFYLIENTEIEEKYAEFCTIIRNKYGEGESYRNFKYPYEDTADDLEMAVKGGYASIVTYWSKSFTNSDAISVEIISAPAIKLSYQNGTLIDEATKVKTDKDKVAF